MGLRFTVLIIQYACFPHISIMRLYILTKLVLLFNGGSRGGHRGHVPPSYFLIHYLIATTLTANYSKPWPINYLTSYLYRSYVMHIE